VEFIEFKLQRICVAEFEITAMFLNKTHALIGGIGGEVHLLEQDTLNIIRKLAGHTSRITCIEYCSALTVVITGSRDKTARVWNAAGECLHVLQEHTNGVNCTAVHGTTYVHVMCLLIIVCFDNTD
jgi:WD40 repeat protein